MFDAGFAEEDREAADVCEICGVETAPDCEPAQAAPTNHQRPTREGKREEVHIPANPGTYKHALTAATYSQSKTDGTERNKNEGRPNNGTKENKQT